MTTATDVRLKARYKSEIQPALKQQFGYKNPMQIPTLVKIVVNMGIGCASGLLCCALQKIWLKPALIRRLSTNTHTNW